MTTIMDIGMNHETAPVQVRELFALGKHNMADAINSIRSIKEIKESIVISTCNRVEILFTSDNGKSARESVVEFFSRFSGMKKEELEEILYMYDGNNAIRHIFRVGASLDSMVIGEPQILGQIKDAYRTAVENKLSSVILNRLMHRTFSLAKKIRTDTGISGFPVSISFAAVELGKKIFGDLHEKEVLLVGAGDMAELAATYLLNNKVANIVVSNRTFTRALEVAEQFHGKAVSFEEIEDQLLKADIVITSTASPEPILHFSQVKEVMKKRKNSPLFFIDIAVPRNVEPRINEIENVFVYDIDDLKVITESNIDKRKNEAIKAERMVDEEVIKFEEWLKTLEVVPTIVALKEKFDKICRNELKKTFSSLKDLTPKQKKGVENLIQSITKKTLNDPIVFLKRKGKRSSRDLYLDIAHQLFNLESDNNDEGIK
jgi:glutamyl-tRNA reductase